jgi:hypothetical protein
MLPEFNHDGNLPEGIHLATEDEVFVRFGIPSARRQWLGEQLRSLVALAKSTGQLARVFLWGSFVTSKEVPNDLDVLLVMSPEFAVEAVSVQAQVLFDHVQSATPFPGGYLLDQSLHGSTGTAPVVGHLPNGEGFHPARDCRGYRLMIANDQQLQLAQAAVENLQRVLLAARKVHSPHEYRLMSAPILLELQQREQEILAYLSRTEPEAVRG